MNRSVPQVERVLPAFMGIMRRLAMAAEYGELASWAQAHTAVTQAFTPPIMADMENHVPGWQRMASYEEGQTLVHVSSVFVTLLNSDEYRQAGAYPRCLWEWVALLHDLAKVAQTGKRDRTHAFRSTALAARMLPALGFPVLPAYEEMMEAWERWLVTAVLPTGEGDIQDNRWLPALLRGIALMFGPRTAAALILQSILLHHSFSPVVAWPNPAALTDAEIKAYVTLPLWRLLGPFLLFDSTAWDMYDEPETLQKHTAEIRACILDVAHLLPQTGRTTSRPA